MKNVIACIDATPVSEAVCEAAAWISQRLEAPLEFVHVLENQAATTQTTDLSGNIGLGARSDLLEALAGFDEQRAKIARESGRAVLRKARDCARDAGIDKPLMLHRRGSLTQTLKHIDERIGLIVLGRHVQHLNEHMGSRLERVVRSIKHPLLITVGDFTPPTSFMVACDGSSNGRKLLDKLVEHQWLRAMPCHLVMVTEKQAAGEKLLALACERLQQAGFDVHTHLTSGRVEQTISYYASENQIGLLVMGAYGHSALHRFFVGSTTTSIIRRAQIPALLMR